MPADELVLHAIVQAAQTAWQHVPNGWHSLVAPLPRASSSSLNGPVGARGSVSYQEHRCTTLVNNGCEVVARLIQLLYPRAGEIVRERSARGAGRKEKDEAGPISGLPDIYSMITCAVRVFHAPLVRVLLDRARAFRCELAKGLVSGYNLLHDLAKTDIERDVAFGAPLAIGTAGVQTSAVAARGPSNENKESTADEKAGMSTRPLRQPRCSFAYLLVLSVFC